MGHPVEELDEVTKALNRAGNLNRGVADRERDHSCESRPRALLGPSVLHRNEVLIDCDHVAGGQRERARWHRARPGRPRDFAELCDDPARRSLDGAGKIERHSRERTSGFRRIQVQPARTDGVARHAVSALVQHRHEELRERVWWLGLFGDWAEDPYSCRVVTAQDRLNTVRGRSLSGGPVCAQEPHADQAWGQPPAWTSHDGSRSNFRAATALAKDWTFLAFGFPDGPSPAPGSHYRAGCTRDG